MLLTLTFSLSVYAQNITVSGNVTDNTGEPLIGATVMQKGTQHGVATDIDGNYSISVPAKSTIVFSYIGCDTKEVAVNGQNKIDVVLESNSTVLDEVVAIGYGTVKKKDLTGAVSSVAGSDLAKVPATSAAAALQGKAAGLNIVSQSAAPGAKLNITVRGGTSLTQGTSPLYVVDGFVMSDALTNIDINDIETIDVLKDASSTAIYGARGSNGIIVITTKSAQKGKTKIDYNGYVAFDRLSKKLDMMDNALDYVGYQFEFANLQNKLNAYSTVYDDHLGTDAADFYTGAYDRIKQRYGDSYALDWQDLTFGGHATTQNHNVSLSTGTDKLRVLLSYNYTDQDGLLANHDYKRNSIRAKINGELWKGVSFDFSTFYYDNVTHGGGSYSGMKSVLLQPINGGTYFTADELQNSEFTFRDYRGLDSYYDTGNPLVANLASTSESHSRRFETTGGITIDFLNHFKWRTSGNYHSSWGKGTSFADKRSSSYVIDQANTGMNGAINNSESDGWNITNTLTSNFTFNEKHELNILIGQEYSASESTKNNWKLRKFPDPNHGLDDISNAEVYEKESGHSESNMLSFFARANYDYDSRYILTATFRADGSSKFAKGNKWGYFPSVSAAWRISQEKFWAENGIASWFNNFKFRAGYGVTGNNDIGANLYETNASLTTYPMNNNENSPAYVVGTTLGNKKLKWETLHATNIGVDLGFFNNRIMLTAEWYNNEISDMLMKCVIPKTTGYSYQYQNIGKMRNRGWEFQLNTVNISTHGFQWTSNFNISFNKSKVLKLEDEQGFKTFGVGGNRAGTVTYYAMVGERLGDMYGYKYDGIYTTDDFEETADGKFTLKPGVVRPFAGTSSSDTAKDPMPGDIKFAADNDDPDNPEFTRKLVKIGNGTPDFTGGFGNTFTYKGFDLYAFMKFSVGNDIYNATKHSMLPYASFQNTPKEFGNNYYRLIDPATGRQATTLSRIRELNPDESSRTWSLSQTNSGYITYPNSYFVEDGSYLRIAQVTLGYTLPEKLTKKAMISKLRIYFTANNLCTITGYDGYNPDSSSANDNVICTPGYDSSSYPLSRSYVVGVNLSF
ncbi:MAG: TonB-dependent receptor [Bacteroides sp.]|nr:TonB-dependent receptor [Bacteroides sp.]